MASTSYEPLTCFFDGIPYVFLLFSMQTTFDGTTCLDYSNLREKADLHLKHLQIIDKNGPFWNLALTQKSIRFPEMNDLQSKGGGFQAPLFLDSNKSHK